MEINYNAKSLMTKGFPEIKKLGAVSPCGESTPFVFNDKLYRLELCDPSRGTDMSVPIYALIRDRETGKIISRFAENCYYQSFYQENGTAYVLGTKSKRPATCGDTILIYESKDLINWTERELLKNEGWQYYNTSLTKGPDGYVLCMEAGAPKEYVGDYPFTCFFATSPEFSVWKLLYKRLYK